MAAFFVLEYYGFSLKLNQELKDKWKQIQFAQY